MRDFLDRVWFDDRGRVRELWKVLGAVGALALVTALVVPTVRTDDSATDARDERAGERTVGAGAAAEPDAGAGTSTDEVPTLRRADASEPALEPYGVYRSGKVLLRGSAPSADVAERFRQRIATVIGAENVISEMTLDPRVEAETMYIDVEEEFRFPEGSVAYDADFDALLTLGAFALELLPESTLVVTGHTDSTGGEATNQALSVARAQLVVDFMVRGGIDRDRMVARGAGEREPIADNATPEGRQANRRLEARLEGIRP